MSLDAASQAKLGKVLDESMRAHSWVYEEAVGEGPRILDWKEGTGAQLVAEILRLSRGRRRVRLRDARDRAREAKVFPFDGSRGRNPL